MIDDEIEIQKIELPDLSYEELYELKRKGFSDSRIASLTCASEEEVRRKKGRIENKASF